MYNSRVTVAEAAQILGVSQHAVRQRIYRGTLQHEKDTDGKVYVLLTASDTGHLGEIHGEQPGETHDRDVAALERMISMLEEQNTFLRDQLQQEREENRRKDHLLAAALKRIPAIEPPAEESPDTPESPVTASEEEGSGQAPSEPETAKSEPWWRRIFR